MQDVILEANIMFSNDQVTQKDSATRTQEIKEVTFEMGLKNE